MAELDKIGVDLADHIDRQERSMPIYKFSETKSQCCGSYLRIRFGVIFACSECFRKPICSYRKMHPDYCDQCGCRRHHDEDECKKCGHSFEEKEDEER